MDRYPMIQRWGDNQNLNMVTDNRGVKYIPFTKIAYLEVVDADPEPEVPDWAPSEYPPSSIWEDYRSEREDIISRQAFERDTSTLYRNTFNFEIPRPAFEPIKHSPSKQRRILTVRDPRGSISAPVPRVKQSRDRFVYTSRPATTREPRGYWSVLSHDPPLPVSKPKFRYKNLGIYPPKRDGEGLIGKKRQLIKEAIASSDPGFEFYGRESFGQSGRVSPHPIYLPGGRSSRPNTPPIPDRTYFRSLTPYVDYNYRSPTPPLPDRRYRETDLEPSTSVINAFTPFEGQIAYRNRTPVLAKWQDTLNRPVPRKHVFLESTKRLYNIEENPDY